MQKRGGGGGEASVSFNIVVRQTTSVRPAFIRLLLACWPVERAKDKGFPRLVNEDRGLLFLLLLLLFLPTAILSALFSSHFEMKLSLSLSLSLH